TLGIPAFYFLLIVAVIVAIIRYDRFKHTPLALALPYLVVNLIAETYGIFTTGNDYWIYNIATIIEFGFYFYIFHRTITSVQLQKVIIWFSFLYFPFAIINVFLIQGIDHFHTNSFLVGSVFLIFLAGAYLRQLLINIEMYNPLRESMFWITTGVLFFYIGSFFYLGFFEYIQQFYPALINIFSQVVNILNVILYCMYIIAFNVRSKY
ncbi:MAG: hypothetical protein ACXWCG_08705, partial [Flavitalea sp.]